MLEGFYLRRPKDDDLEAVLALMIACDMRDVGFPDSDRDDLRADWDRMDLSNDAWLVFDKNHDMKGYGAVMDWSTGKLVGVYDAPGSEDTDVFLALTILCEGRARIILQSLGDDKKKTIAHYISDTADYQKKTLEEAGYSLTKYLFNMHRDLNERLAAPTWPEDIQLRTIDAGKDDEALHTLIQDAFEKPGHERQPFVEWQSTMMNPATFIPEIWFLLESQGELIGCALCYEYDDLGWVRQLAVRNDQRGRGLGRKLLEHAFFGFKERGFLKAGLAVEAENTHALKLYKSAGMHKAVHLDEFSKSIIPSIKKP